MKKQTVTELEIYLETLKKKYPKILDGLGMIVAVRYYKLIRKQWKLNK